MFFGANDSFDQTNLSLQDLLVKKQEGIEGLVLSRSADMRFRRQTGQKRSNLASLISAE
jgi:hypothetical protein